MVQRIGLILVSLPLILWTVLVLTSLHADADAMVAELRTLSIDLVISIWPMVNRRSLNYQQMLEAGHLVRPDRDLRIAMDFMGETVHFDATKPSAREYV